MQVDPDLLLITQDSLAPKVKFAVLVTGAEVVAEFHEGAVFAPFEVNTCPTAPEGSFAKVVVVLAYNKSPIE